MYWVPQILFLLSGVFAAIAQQRFLDPARSKGVALRSDRQFVDKVEVEPRRLVTTAAHETRVRLKALLSRQADEDLEAKRWTALGAIALTLACLVLVVAR